MESDEAAFELCDVCAAPAALVCSRCRAAVYCSQACQVQEWDDACTPHALVCAHWDEMSSEELAEECADYTDTHAELAALARGDAVWSRSCATALLQQQLVGAPEFVYKFKAGAAKRKERRARGAKQRAKFRAGVPRVTEEGREKKRDARRTVRRKRAEQRRAARKKLRYRRKARRARQKRKARRK